MDALMLLMSDHRKVETLFKDYELATSPGTRKEVVDSLSKELSIHSSLEETDFYPEVKKKLPRSPAPR